MEFHPDERPTFAENLEDIDVVDPEDLYLSGNEAEMFETYRRRMQTAFEKDLK